MQWPELWESDSMGARLLRATLTPASWLYEVGWSAYRLTYDLGLKRASEPFKPVVCIGNLRVGGTGKTPVTTHIAEVLQRLGFRAVLSVSGYGSPASEGASLAPEGSLKAGSWGDETAVLRDCLPDLPIIVGRNRVSAAKICATQFAGAVLLMDDGFQHLPLKKHLSLLLDPETGNRRCLPAGPYREPQRNRRRADLTLPGEFEVRYTPLRFVDARSGVPIDRMGEVQVLCAIGSPQAFCDAVTATGSAVLERKVLADHDQLEAGNLLDGLDAGVPIVVTAKDWVKLRERSDLDGYSVAVALREALIEPAVEFEKWLVNKLHGLVA